MYMAISKLKLVFMSILGIGAILFSCSCLKRNSFDDVNRLRSKDVVAITLYDRGIVGSDTLAVNNLDTLNLISRLIISSQKVDFDSLNTKANQGLCELRLLLKNSKSLTVEIIKTSFSGGVLSSGGYYYRNDSLLNLINGSLDPKNKIKVPKM